MGFRAIRRAATTAVALALVVSGLALADTTPADADALTLGIQGSLHLGDLAPGAAVDLQVGITLRCANGVHAERGSTIAVELESATYLPSGSAVVTSGSIGPVPADWPLDGEPCTSIGVPSLAAATPVGISFTAPAAPGPYEYAFTFARTPDTGISGISGVAFTFEVVEPDSADTTGPVLTDGPSDIRVITSDPAGATVTWTDPTATDDTDPNPTVACLPASGSAFPVGTTTVTCIATDGSGNETEASFTVAVVLGSAVWGAPLGSASPLAANLGRVVPVRVALTLDGHPLVPIVGSEGPHLAIQRLAACGGTPLATADAGPMAWNDDAWSYRLDTGALSTGCWRLVATVDGVAVGSTELRVSETAVGQVSKALKGRASR